MPLTPQDTAFLKDLFAKFDPYKPLDPGSPFYQPN